MTGKISPWSGTTQVCGIVNKRQFKDEFVFCLQYVLAKLNGHSVCSERRAQGESSAQSQTPNNKQSNTKKITQGPCGAFSPSEAVVDIISPGRPQLRLTPTSQKCVSSQSESFTQGDSG